MSCTTSGTIVRSGDDALKPSTHLDVSGAETISLAGLALRREFDKLARLALWWNNSALLDSQEFVRRPAEAVKEA